MKTKILFRSKASSSVYFYLSTLLVAITIMICSLNSASAFDISFKWNANTDSIQGYMIYYKEGGSGIPYNGTGAVEGSSPIEVGNITEYTIHGLNDGMSYAFTATAFNADGESDYSTEVYIHTIYASSDENGNIEPNGTAILDDHADQTYTITPNQNYHIADVIVDGNSVGPVQSYSFTDLTSGHTISAIFAINTYTVTASTSGNGTISPAGSLYIPEGQSRTFTITPDTNNHIVDVIVDGSSVGAVSHFTFSNVNADHTIEAIFGASYQTITATAGPNGSISPSGSVDVGQSENKTFAITPNDNCHIVDVIVDGSSVGAVNSYTFNNLVADHTISALFAIDSHLITASAGTGGSISPTGSVTVEHGENKTFVVTAAAGHQIIDVLVDGVSMGPIGSYTFSNVADVHAISAVFDINTHTVTASAGANGSISPSGVVDVGHGEGVTFTIIPGANHHVVDVLVDGSSVGAVSRYEFTNMTTDHTISAIFGVNTYSITASAGENGSISPAGGVDVGLGENRTFTITPDANHHIVDVIVDGSSIGSVSSYTFINVTADHTISAIFDINTHTITASTGADGSISPSGPVVVGQGESKTFTMAPDINHLMEELLINDVPVTASSAFTFDNVDTDHFVRVNFAKELLIDNGNVVPQYTGVWQLSTAGGYYGENSVETTDENATYTFKTVAKGLFEISLWWTEQEDRCSEIPVEIYNGMDLLDSFMINQQENGGKWNTIGVYEFNGDVRIVIKSSGSHCSVNADAAFIAWQPELDHIEINGPDSIEENSSVQLMCMAHYGDGSMRSVKADSWEVDTSYLEVSTDGKLTASSVESDEFCNVSAVYSEGNRTRSETLVIKVVNSDPPEPVDTDNDGISDDDEIGIYGTDPDNPDTDGDGIEDGDEKIYWGDRWNQDIDKDGTPNLLDWDSDGDGFSDGTEIAQGFDPGNSDSKPGTVPQTIPIETGVVSINHEWQRVNFNKIFINPIVVANTLSNNGREPAVVQIRNLDSTGFDIRAKEWEYLNQIHKSETTGYLVMETGNHTLPEGGRIIAGQFESTQTSSFTSFSFNEPFSATPVVMMSTTTVNGNNAATIRMKNITTNGLQYLLQEQEASSPSPGHERENICFIAWEPSSGILDDVVYDVRRTSGSYNHRFKTVTYGISFVDKPVLLACMQTTDGIDTASLRWKKRTEAKVDIKIQEEKSNDKETWHNKEVLAYMAFSH